jgi:glutathione synthase/RimK-type ligase-like ATP-grasp enzyme
MSLTNGSAVKAIVHLDQSGMASDPPVITLNEAWARKLRIPNRIILRYGSFNHTVHVATAVKLRGIRLNRALADKTGLATGNQLLMRYSPGMQTLTLGPLIGVLIERSSGQPGKPFGSNTEFCRELSDACRLYGGACVFFTPGDLHQKQTSITGWVYHGGWRRASVPIPDVVYNRLTSRKTENLPVVQQFFKESKTRYNTVVFNERFLDKTEVFQTLQHEPSVQRYLPESHAFKNFSMLKSMCQKYPIVYLKPVRGSLGKGIIRIVRKDHGYACQYSTVNGTKTQVYPSLEKLFVAIKGRARLQRYQIQEGIRLIQIGSRPIDFRALVQKNRQGKWQVTSIVARIAGSQHFVSNLARGGTLSRVPEALAKSNVKASSAAVLASLRQASLAIAEAIDRSIAEHFGELGIDLAVSEDGHVWLLEVNSKPAKNDTTALQREKIRPSVKQIVMYSHYLCNL